MRRDPKSIHKLAEHAVKDVYQFCPSYSRKSLGDRQFLLETRDAIAAQFRQQYGSTTTINGAERANVFPYFIGVFDTVAAPRTQISRHGARDLRHCAADRAALARWLPSAGRSMGGMGGLA